MQGHDFFAGVGQLQVLRQHPTVVLFCTKAVLNNLQAIERARVRVSFRFFGEEQNSKAQRGAISSAQRSKKTRTIIARQCKQR